MRKYTPYTIATNMKLGYVEHCVADFETCYTSPDKQDVKVWAWGRGNIMNNEYYEGTSLDTFFGPLLASDSVYDIGYHNLKFDGSFIVPWLYKNGFEYLDNNTFMDKWKEGADLSKKFTHNITAMGQWFSITIVKDKKYATKSTPSFIHIWDTLKLFPQTLDEVGRQYCKNYKKIHVDEEFYARLRPDGHRLTPEESEYLKADVLTLCEALKVQYDKYGTIYRTRASKAFTFFKQACTTQDGRSNIYTLQYEGLDQPVIPKIKGIEEWEGKWFRYAPVKIKTIVRQSKKKMEKEVDYYIPDFETWSNIKKSYRGGISFVEPYYAESNINKTVTVLDENSMYPHKMRERKVPYGRFFYHRGRPNNKKYPCWIACARVSFKVKQPYNLPCIQMKEKYGRQWLRESTDYMEQGRMNIYNEDVIWFTSVDYETYKRNYNFKVHEWIQYYGFKNWGNDDGKRFVDKFYQMKQDADAIKTRLESEYDRDYLADNDEYIKACLDRQEAKVIMNSAYGKHGTKYVLLSKDSYFIEELGAVGYTSNNNNFDKEPDDPSHYYCPYAAFITAYARDDLVTMWNSLKGKAVYCDTDSVHFIGTMDDISEDMREAIDWDKTGDLGLWKHEGTFKKARYIRAKTYIEIDEVDKPHVTCAGAPPSIKELMDWDTFKVGFNAWEIAEARGLDIAKHSKLKPQQYPSGVALEGQNFQIKPR